MNTSELLARALPFSPYLQRMINAAHTPLEVLHQWLPTKLNSQHFQYFSDWKNLQESLDESALHRQLRQLRTLVMMHIAVRDLNRISTLDEVVQTISLFAEFAVQLAENMAHALYVKRYGEPIGCNSGEKIRLSVVAMGKAGGRELNVSSDLDLIFIYPEIGRTTGAKEKSNQEFFTLVGKKIIQLLGDISEFGQVFRVDMRLRPDGDAGALVMSEAALEQYLMIQGREWERYAWCKARVITLHKNGIEALVRPFVFRKYLDFNAYDAMRALHEKIRQEVARKGMQNNVKLGAGGIREVEFIAQIYQMIRAGSCRSLRLKGTRETLRELLRLDIINQETHNTLQVAYHFLRDVEHRLQYWDDCQTQTLPENHEQQQQLALSMGFDSYPEFLDYLQSQTSAVSTLFNDILTPAANPQDHNNHTTLSPFVSLWNDAKLLESAGSDVAQLFDSEVLSQLETFSRSSKYQHLSDTAEKRFNALIPAILALIQIAPQSRQGEILRRTLRFLESISRRSSYLALLIEHPKVLQKLVELFAQSQFVADYISRHPILLDELLSNQLLSAKSMQEMHKAELEQSLSEQNQDVEAKMDALRHFQHAHTFRLAVQDLAGLWTLEAVSDQLSLLADVTLQVALQHCQQIQHKKLTHTQHFAVIGYGKLGGKELGYGSDLDLVYLFDDQDPEAEASYGYLAGRLTTWLSAATGAGVLYDIDLRLRPNGESGFAASSVNAFSHYLQQSAWTWEHQALSRARFIAGDKNIEATFNRIRETILCLKRDAHQLQHDIIAMRDKIMLSHPALDSDVKYARGGIVDVEFIVQYWVLLHARNHPSLLQNSGNIALLQTAAQVGLIPETLAHEAASAYRHFRLMQHAQRLKDTQDVAQFDALPRHYDTVKTLWQHVFGEALN